MHGAVGTHCQHFPGMDDVTTDIQCLQHTVDVLENALYLFESRTDQVLLGDRCRYALSITLCHIC